MKIYENANDQHVRKVVLYEVTGGLAFDKAGTELLTKEEIVDAFLKGCVVENEGNYKTPTGVNVTDSGAELVFGGGGSDALEIAIDLTMDQETYPHLVKGTYDEIVDAVKAGRQVKGYTYAYSSYGIQKEYVVEQISGIFYHYDEYLSGPAWYLTVTTPGGTLGDIRPDGTIDFND